MDAAVWNARFEFVEFLHSGHGSFPSPAASGALGYCR